ncbi:hypothetical protein [Scytonema sp. NUACC26]|uniref:hypothetical protein n=1 Tax=Scytonema sp. NUACC26 TaxID=3140176 RepID=UPI0034DC5B55
MSEYKADSYQNVCEFTVPIKLNVPIYIEPTVAIKAPNAVREKVAVYLESDINLSPEVKALPPVCNKNGYDKYQSSAEQTA